MERFAQRVKRVETWLRDRPWVIWGIRGTTWCFALFWVFAFGGTIERDRLRVAREGKYFREHRSQLTVSQREGELRQKAEAYLTKAEQKGLDFGPKEYFVQLRNLESQARKDKIRVDRVKPITERMYALVEANCKVTPPLEDREAMQQYFKDPRKWDIRELHEARKAYQMLQGYSEEDIRTDKKDLVNLSRGEKIRWLTLAWLRGMPVMLLLFLLRMVEKRGILATILADKRAFYRAIVDWPMYVFVYPDSITKEVLVEAELRRIGGLFRRLNPVERLRIQEIASADNFKERLATLRRAYKPEYQRGLALALLATVLLMLLPRLSEAKPSRTSVNPQGVALVMTRTGPTIQVDLGAGDLPMPAFAVDCALPDWPEVLTLGLEPLAIWWVQPPRQEVLRRIDHVPEANLVVQSRSSTGRQRGDRNELVARGCAVRSPV